MSAPFEGPGGLKVPQELPERLNFAKNNKEDKRSYYLIIIFSLL